jgi:hypothetical protein
MILLITVKKEKATRKIQGNNSVIKFQIYFIEIVKVTGVIASSKKFDVVVIHCVDECQKQFTISIQFI